MHRAYQTLGDNMSRSQTNPFHTHQYDLGTTSAYTRSEVDEIFRVAPFNVPVYACIVCGQPAQYQLIPKAGNIPQHILDREGYICQYHLEQKLYSPQYYAIRPLDRDHASAMLEW